MLRGWVDLVGTHLDSISYDNCSPEKAERIYSAIIDKALELLPRYADAAELDSMVDEIIRFT